MRVSGVRVVDGDSVVAMSSISPGLLRLQVPSFEWLPGGPVWFLLECQSKKCGCVFQEIGNLVIFLLL